MQRALNINDEKRIPRAQTGRGVPPALLGVAGLTALLVLLPLTYLILRALEADGQNLREIVFRVRTLELLEEEIRICMGLLGVTSLAQLTPRHVTRAAPVFEPNVLSAFPLLDQYDTGPASPNR